MRHRPGYTLLEVLLALAIAVLLMAALYTAVGYQLRHAQSGRDLIGQATFARGIFSRMAGDIAATAGLCDPTRFRNPVNTSASGSASSSSSSSGSSSASGGASGGSTSTTGTSSTASSTTSSSTSSSSTTSSSTTAGATTSTTTTSSSGTTVVTLPLGVIGDGSSLNLFVSRVPNEVWGATPNDQGSLVSDLRRIVYWAGSNGLCRQEVKVVTSQDALNLDIPSGDVSSYVMAPEVHSVEFSYFDGTNWTDTWDSTLIIGADGVTPQGSPRTIAVKIGVVPPGDRKDGDKEPDLKYYRHVVLIASANGVTPLTQPNPNNPAVLNNTNSATASGGASGTNSTTGN